MLRTILLTLAGIVAAFLIVTVVEGIGHTFWTPPADLDPTNMESLRAAMEQMPTIVLLSVAIAWTLGALGGAWLAARLTRLRWPAYIVGGLVALAGVANNLMLPHPFWYWIAALVAVPLAAFLGGWMGAGGRNEEEGMSQRDEG